MPKYISGRSKKVPLSELRVDRYRYLSVGESEPSLGDPLVGPSSIGAKPVTAGQQYIVVTTATDPGERYWIPNQGGLIPGSISVFEENSLVGGASSTTQLIFKGNSVTATGVAGPPPGIGVTITIKPPGNDNEVLFKDSGDFATDSTFTFDSVENLLAAGDRITVGAGGTVITTTGIGSVGIGTTNPTQELHLQGDFRITGDLYDSTNSSGQPNYLLTKAIGGGLLWVREQSIITGAGGTIGQIQFHNTAGLVDGADNFYYDFNNNRVGIGSTQPTQLLDVLGVSTFSGGVFIDNLSVSGFSTFNEKVIVKKDIDVDGHTELDNLNVSGFSTFKEKVIIEKDIDVDGHTEVDDFQASGISTFTNTQNNTLGNVNTGSVQLDGGAGIAKNLTVGQTIQATNLNITGIGTIAEFDFGTGVFDHITVTGISTLGNVVVNTNTISTKTGTLNLNSAGNSVQVDSTDRLVVNRDLQATNTTDGAFVVAGGAGIAKNLYVGGNLDVDGAIELDDLNITGVATFRGNVDIGDATTDTVTITASVDSDIIPSGTRDLGSASNPWDTVYASTFSGNSATADYATRAGLATDLEINASNRLLYQVSNNNTDVLPAGTANYLLQSNGTGSAPTWVDPTNLSVTKADNLSGGAAGSLPYQSALDTTTFLTEPNGDGYVLTYNNSSEAPQWSVLTDLPGAGYTFGAVDSGDNVILRLSDGSTTDDVTITAGTNITINPVAEGGFTISASDSVGTADTATDLAGGTAGDLVYQDGPGSTAFLEDPGASGDGYVLTWNDSGTVPQWSDLTTLSGAGYTFGAVDSGDNVILRLSDGSTTDDVTITAGTNITINPVAEGGFTISASDSVGTADTATDLAGGAAGSIPYQDGPGSTTFLSEPNGDGYVLTYNNTSEAPQWSVLTTLSGAGYTFGAVDSGDNVILRLSDGSTTDDVTITAGSGISIDPVAEGGFTISGSGGGFDFSGLQVYEETSSVGTSFTALKFIGNSITASDGGSGIANITVSVDYGDVSNTPDIPGDIGDLTDTGGLIPGDIGDLTDTGGLIPSDIGDLTDTGGLIPSDVGDLTNNVGFITGITVKDEETTLTTAATILKFVGAGVTASGTGAEKTITINGGGAGGGTLTNVDQTGYSCDNPISVSADGTTIGIGTTSNAYGTRYVENYLPLSSDGCDGDLWYYTAGSAGGGVLTGTIHMWGGGTGNIPTGYQLCDGSAPSTSALQAIVGSIVPDLRNRFIVGAASDVGTGVIFNADTGAVTGDYAPGDTGGSVAHQLTVAEMPSHNHTYDRTTAPSDGQDKAGEGSGDAVTINQSNTGSKGGNDYHENRPPYYALVFMIKT